MLHTLHIFNILHTARIEDEDPGFEHDTWKMSEESQQLLRADRWFYKGMDRLRDHPEKSGQLVCFCIMLEYTHSVHMIDILHMICD